MVSRQIQIFCAGPYTNCPTESSNLSPPLSPTSSNWQRRPSSTTPERLYLRPIISPSPLSPLTFTSAPDLPYPWTWRCHLCDSVYRLGVTRRCLEDGHFFCSVPTPPPVSNGPRESGSRSESDKKGKKMEGRKRATECDETGEGLLEVKVQKRKKPRRAVGCIAEFDYSGWSDYNWWRREIQMHRFEKAAVAALRKDDRDDSRIRDAEWKGEKNCWEDCEFPSECHNLRFDEARTRTRAQATHEIGSGEEWSFSGKIYDIHEQDRELQEEMLRQYEAAELEDPAMDDFYQDEKEENERYSEGCPIEWVDFDAEGGGKESTQH